MEGRKIMFIGNQFAPSFDRPNNRPDRVWNGPGDVVAGVPPIQAATLLNHPKEWADVTHLDGPELVRAQQAARARSEKKVRELHNPPDAPNNQRTLDAASDDELEAELDRRMKAKGLIASAPTAKPTPIESKKPTGVLTDTKLREAVSAAAEKVLLRAQEDTDAAKSILNDDGLPTYAAVQEALGFPITEDDYRSALGLEDAAAA